MMLLKLFYNMSSYCMYSNLFSINILRRMQYNLRLFFCPINEVFTRELLKHLLD